MSNIHQRKLDENELIKAEMSVACKCINTVSFNM